MIGEVRELMGVEGAWTSAADVTLGMVTDRCQAKSIKVAIVLRNDKFYYEYVYKTVSGTYHRCRGHPRCVRR